VGHTDYPKIGGKFILKNHLIRGRSGKGAQIDYDRLYAYHIFADLDATMKEPEATGI
jgi:hypothetical protein